MKLAASVMELNVLKYSPFLDNMSTLLPKYITLTSVEGSIVTFLIVRMLLTLSIEIFIISATLTQF